MKTLYGTLYVYAQEHRVNRFLLRRRTESLQAQRCADQALEQLAAMGTIAAGCAEQLQKSMFLQAGLDSQAAFLAGLSMGLELGRLGHGM